MLCRRFRFDAWEEQPTVFIKIVSILDHCHALGCIAEACYRGLKLYYQPLPICTYTVNYSTCQLLSVFPAITPNPNSPSISIRSFQDAPYNRPTPLAPRLTRYSPRRRHSRTPNTRTTAPTPPHQWPTPVYQMCGLTLAVRYQLAGYRAVARSVEPPRGEEGLWHPRGLSSKKPFRKALVPPRPRIAHLSSDTYGTRACSTE
jgi:hypothetical protein